jgi:uncharacterized protein Usg
MHKTFFLWKIYILVPALPKIQAFVDYGFVGVIIIDDARHNSFMGLPK